VSIFDTVERLAASAADGLAAILRQAIAEHGTTAAIFATAIHSWRSIKRCNPGMI